MRIAPAKAGVIFGRVTPAKRRAIGGARSGAGCGTECMSAWSEAEHALSRNGAGCGTECMSAWSEAEHALSRNGAGCGTECMSAWSEAEHA